MYQDLKDEYRELREEQDRWLKSNIEEREREKEDDHTPVEVFNY